MIISHKYKLVFIHIGKTGGDSINATLKPFLEKGDVYIDNSELHPAFNKHEKALRVSIAFQELGWNWDEYFSFLILRDPFETIYSDYWYHKYLGFMHGEPKKGIKDYGWYLKCWETRNITLDEYAKKCYGEWDKGFIRNYAQDKNGEQIISHICMFNNLQEDFNYVCKAVGLPQITLENKNTTKEIVEILNTMNITDPIYLENKKRPPMQFGPEFYEHFNKIFDYDFKYLNSFQK